MSQNWKKVSKKNLNDENKEDTNANLFVHEDGEKENMRAKLGQKESEHLVMKIMGLVEDLKHLKREIDLLRKVVNERQTSLLEKIRSSIDVSINELFSKIDFKVMDDEELNDTSVNSSESN